jgi:hypothetical protein
MAQPAPKSVAGLSTIAQKWSRLLVKSRTSFSLLEEKADATSASLVLPRGRGFSGSSPAQSERGRGQVRFLRAGSLCSPVVVRRPGRSG